MAEYKVVRLNSAEEIIGKVNPDNPNQLINPAVILVEAQPDSTMRAVLVPFMPYADDYKVTIPNMDSLITCIPEIGITSNYRKIYDKEAIILPESKIVLA